MAATSRLAAFKDAVGDALSARAALSNVQVFTADPGGDRAAYEFIALTGEDYVEQEWAGIGKFSRNEVITLTGAIYVKRPGKGEAVIREARTRALALMAEIENAFTGTPGDPSLGGVVRSAKARPAEMREVVGGDGERVVLLRFEIQSGQTRLTAS